MSVSERIIFLAIGGAIGFILGYMVRALSCIQQDTSELKEVMKRDKDAGLVRYPILLDVCLFIVVALTVYAAFQSQRASNRSDNAVDQVQQSNVVACENANETREANKQLWHFIIAVSSSSPGNQKDPKALAYLKTIQDWIDLVYRPHDCNDLDKKYPIPPPPKILTFSKQKHK